MKPQPFLVPRNSAALADLSPQAPEVLDGQRATAASDVYAFGLVMYGEEDRSLGNRRPRCGHPIQPWFKDPWFRNGRLTCPACLTSAGAWLLTVSSCLTLVVQRC